MRGNYFFSASVDTFAWFLASLAYTYFQTAIFFVVWFSKGGLYSGSNVTMGRLNTEDTPRAHTVTQQRFPRGLQQQISISLLHLAARY